ncbi:ATP-binding protein [Nonomuraea sp. NPDC050786]|uniref:ATP-binding protein n=1 Tax=Nonomuraea sp. NPDC050786 TaxID=3154840 RepID=UPI0033E8459C
MPTADMSLISSVRLPRDDKAPRQARRIVTGWLGGDDVLLPDALLVMVEMITNAVQHVESGEGRDWVMLRLLHGRGVLHVEVTDPGSSRTSPEALNGEADPQPPPVASGRGRALHIVRVISEGRCGTYVNDEGHRVVWADLPCPDAPARRGSR